MREGGARSQETGPRTGRGEGLRGGYPTTEGMGCIGGAGGGRGRGRAGMGGRGGLVVPRSEEKEGRGRQGVVEKERQRSGG